MDKKHNWQAYKAIIEQQGIKKLYHFTDRDNLHSIIQMVDFILGRTAKKKVSPLQSLEGATVRVRSMHVMACSTMFV